MHSARLLYTRTQMQNFCPHIHIPNAHYMPLGWCPQKLAPLCPTITLSSASANVSANNISQRIFAFTNEYFCRMCDVYITLFPVRIVIIPSNKLNGVCICSYAHCYKRRAYRNGLRKCHTRTLANSRRDLREGIRVVLYPKSAWMPKPVARHPIIIFSGRPRCTQGVYEEDGCESYKLCACCEKAFWGRRMEIASPELIWECSKSDLEWNYGLNYLNDF